MRFTKKELLDLFAKSGAVMDEVYQWDTAVGKYTNDGPHGEYVSFMGDISEALSDNQDYDCSWWVMGEEEYNNSIMCPFGDKANFLEEYEDKNAKVFVVAIKRP